MLGALGGAVGFGGRRVASEKFWGAGLFGRQVNALGASITRNASLGQPALSTLSVPLGPVIIDVQRTAAEQGWSVRANVYETAWLLSAVLDDDEEFDAAASISAGALVFQTPVRIRSGDKALNGATAAGLIFLGPTGPGIDRNNVFAHERVHVLQYDYAQIAWGGPVEDWLLSGVPGGRQLVRFLRPGIAYPLFQRSLTRLLDLDPLDRPWELEAEWLEGR